MDEKNSRDLPWSLDRFGTTMGRDTRIVRRGEMCGRGEHE
jgi:hypothetical protein